MHVWVNKWCKWQQDQALGTSMCNGDDCLPEVLFELLKPTFLTLSDSKLLERCVKEVQLKIVMSQSML